MCVAKDWTEINAIIIKIIFTYNKVLQILHVVMVTCLGSKCNLYMFENIFNRKSIVYSLDVCFQICFVNGRRAMFDGVIPERHAIG